MLNILSTYAEMKKVTGPSKVLHNTLKGLDLIRYPYVLNRSLSSTKRVWIQSGFDALPYVSKIRANTVIGPNVACFPSDIDQFDLHNALYVQPGPTAVLFWQLLGFKQCPLVHWAAGIDTDIFTPGTGLQKNLVLLYYKQRDIAELYHITRILSDKNIDFMIIPYGYYLEDEFLKLLSGACFIIWLGGNESQGIALQEAMSCNVPVLVCDVTKLGQSVHTGVDFSGKLAEIPATAVPYFDNRCGIRITDLALFDQSLEEMLDRLSEFCPRDFVMDNLSLELQARKLVQMWEHWGIDVEAGYNETIANSRHFRVSILRKLGDKSVRLFRRIRNENTFNYS